jgi:hypothetical protein
MMTTPELYTHTWETVQADSPALQGFVDAPERPRYHRVAWRIPEARQSAGIPHKRGSVADSGRYVYF